MGDTLMPIPEAAVMDTAPPGEPVELICSEVWGGNRPADTVVTLPGLTSFVYSNPCGGSRGGDVHYITTCSAGMVSRLLVADVIGHGEQVAAVSGWLHRLMRRQMNTYDPRRVLRKLNAHLAKRGTAAMTTAVCLNYRADLGRVTYCYAGHPPAWVHRGACDQWSELRLSDAVAQSEPDAPTDSITNLPLGVSDDTRFESASVDLEPGDRIVVVSDGILEARDSRHAMLGTDTFHAMLRSHTGLDIVEFGRAVLGSVFEFAGAKPLTHDDATLIAMEAGPRMEGMKMWVMFKQQVRKFMRNRRHD